MSTHPELDCAYQRSLAYLNQVARRRVGAAATRQALLDSLGGPLPVGADDPARVIERLAERADPGLVATVGPRYFGFVTGGAVPVTVAAEWLAASWDQNGAMYAMSPATAVLEDIVAGTTLAALAHDEPDNHYELGRVATTAKKNGNGWVLNGAKAVVPFGDQAQLLLVSARTSGNVGDEAGISLFLVPGDAAGVSARGYGRIDGGHAAELVLTDVQVGADALLGVEGVGHALLERIVGYGLLALSAESLGAMEKAKGDTLEYLRTRKQFGVPIGSFQALQHRMADMLLEVEQARSAVINAAAAIDEEDRVAREKALSAAKYSIGKIGTLIAEEAIQMHGGIGVTWELPLAHYAKRLVMIDHQLGDMDHHLARWMAL